VKQQVLQANDIQSRQFFRHFFANTAQCRDGG
jgi:hypothetical protein